MQRAELALKLKAVIAAEAKARQVAAGKEHGRGQKKVSEKSHEPIADKRTDEKLAEMAGVSSNTIRRVEKIVTEANTSRDIIAPLRLAGRCARACGMGGGG